MGVRARKRSRGREAWGCARGGVRRSAGFLTGAVLSSGPPPRASCLQRHPAIVALTLRFGSPTMTYFPLSDAQIAWRDKAQATANDVLAPRSADNDRTATFPKEQL